MRKSILAVAVAAATVVSGANAAGFYLKELSITGQGRAFAGSVADTSDASAVYFNPAATADMTEAKRFSGGVHVISPTAQITNTGTTHTTLPTAPTETVGSSSGNPYSSKPIPHIYLTVPFREGVLGFGVNNPFGFSNEYDKGWFGRYSSTKTELKTPSFNFTYGQRLNDIVAIGVGVEAQKGDATLEQALPISNSITSAYVGDVNGALTASSDFEFTPFFGVTIKPSQKTTIGFSHREGIDHTASGTLTLSANSSAPEDQGALAIAQIAAGGSSLAASAKLSTPDITSLGLTHSISDSTTVYADVTRYGWAAYKDLVINLPTSTSVSPQNYSNTVSWSLGVEHDYKGPWAVRAGVMLDPTPTNDTDRNTLTPDADRTWISFGGTYSANEKMDIDFAYTRVQIEDGKIDLNKPLSLAGNNLGSTSIKADVTGSANILSLGLRYKF